MRLASDCNQPALERGAARVSSWLLVLLGLLGACSGQGRQTTHEYTPPNYTKPGSSLMQVACSCLACVNREQCAGRSPLARDQEGCEHGFQVEQTTRLETAVSTCQPSCFRRSWSVHVSERCEAKLPEDCCAEAY